MKQGLIKVAVSTIGFQRFSDMSIFERYLGGDQILDHVMLHYDCSSGELSEPYFCIYWRDKRFVK
jgi:hypothetical protein